MADYRTQFSCLFDVGTAVNADRARSFKAQLDEELKESEGVSLGFDLEVDQSPGAGMLWLHSEEDGQPEHVALFVRRCAETFGLEGRWGFCWALTCSRPHLDGFGGGAQILDLATGMTVGQLDCEHWLTTQLASMGGSDRGVSHRDPLLPERKRCGGDIWRP